MAVMHEPVTAKGLLETPPNDLRRGIFSEEALEGGRVLPGWTLTVANVFR